MISVFPKSLKVGRSNKLENITLRGFGGGWNAIETDMQMESTYLVTVRNFRRTPGGTQKIRYGSKWFADLTGLTTATNIIDMEYFSDHLICVLDVGWVIAVDGSGTKTVIWSPTIAAALPGTPAFWHSMLDSVDFVPFKNELIIHNGIDKPITISRTLVTTYLQDLASGSNVNTPIGKYGCVVQNYHCVAGVPATPTIVYVSSVGTAGTFFGDPIPNDSITIDIGAYAPQGALDIRGIAGFRTNLLVFFQSQTVVVKLGTYNATGDHVPTFPDAMPTFGILGHRCMVPLENDMIFAGLAGIDTARRSLLSGTSVLESQSLSDRIEPPYRKAVGALTDDQQLKKCWMVHDSLSSDVLLFTPSGQVFVYSFNRRLQYAAWSEYSDLNVQCGCKTFLGRLFYADGLHIYQHGNRTFMGEDYTHDRQFDHTASWVVGTFYPQDAKILDPTIGTVFVCLQAHISTGTFFSSRNAVPPIWAEYKGIPISFQMELPWLDSKDPMRIKFLRFISMATKGDSEFTVNAYVDNLFRDVDGNLIYGPAATMDFIGNEAVGFGYDAGPYGGGRRSDDPRLFKFPAKFKKLKITISGLQGGNLEIVNMSFLFSRGRYKR